VGVGRPGPMDRASRVARPLHQPAGLALTGVAAWAGALLKTAGSPPGQRRQRRPPLGEKPGRRRPGLRQRACWLHPGYWRGVGLLLCGSLSRPLVAPPANRGLIRAWIPAGPPIATAAIGAPWSSTQHQAASAGSARFDSRRTLPPRRCGWGEKPWPSGRNMGRLAGGVGESVPDLRAHPGKLGLARRLPQRRQAPLLPALGVEVGGGGGAA